MEPAPCRSHGFLLVKEFLQLTEQTSPEFASFLQVKEKRQREVPKDVADEREDGADGHANEYADLCAGSGPNSSEHGAGAHFLGRALREQGHEVRIMPAQYVKPFVKTNKSDFIDAEAIAEAVGRPTMRLVPIKTDDQLDLQSLHRIRERWVIRRTAVVNQIRGLLLERGITLR
jgi:hypothetical protein